MHFHQNLYIFVNFYEALFNSLQDHVFINLNIGGGGLLLRQPQGKFYSFYDRFLNIDSSVPDISDIESVDVLSNSDEIADLYVLEGLGDQSLLQSQNNESTIVSRLVQFLKEQGISIVSENAYLYQEKLMEFIQNEDCDHLDEIQQIAVSCFDRSLLNIQPYS